MVSMSKFLGCPHPIAKTQPDAGTSSWPSWISHFTGSFVGHSPSEMLCPPALGLKRERTEGRKREKFYIYSDVTHTHTPKHQGVPCFFPPWFLHWHHCVSPVLDISLALTSLESLALLDAMGGASRAQPNSRVESGCRGRLSQVSHNS